MSIQLVGTDAARALNQLARTGAAAMTTPRRYVRVRMLTHRGALAEWKCEACGEHHSRWTADFAHRQAREHAEDCGHIAAMERDQLRAELDRMRADRDRLRDRLHTATYNLKHQRNDNS